MKRRDEILAAANEVLEAGFSVFSPLLVEMASMIVELSTLEHEAVESDGTFRRITWGKGNWVLSDQCWNELRAEVKRHEMR